MTLLNPAWLLGALGIAVPVLIHLFGRRRPRHIVFPSLMLLEAAQQRRRSPLRIRRLLSLLMRAAAIVLLALALAVPLTRSSLLARIGGGAGLHAVVLDRSASMSADDGFPAAVRAAREVTLSLPAGDRILFCRGGADLSAIANLEPLTRSAALNAIEDTPPTMERTRIDDLLSALLARMNQLGSRGTVFVVTDLCASGYGHGISAVGARGSDVVLVDTGREVSANRGVTQVTPSQPFALVNRPFGLRVRTDAWGQTSAEHVPVTVEAGPDAGSAGVSPAPGHSAWADLTLAPSQTGVLEATVALPPDEFPADDGRFVALKVRQALRVLVAGEEARTRYLRAALNPWGDERGPALAAPISFAALGDADLGDCDALVLADPPALPAEALSAIQDEAARGLGVLVFAGSRADGRDYAERLLPELEMAAARLGEAVTWDEPVALTVSERSPGPLAPLLDPAAGDLGQARFTSAHRLAVGVAGDVAIWARYSDGTPAIVGADCGRGHVTVANMAPDDAGSDLVRQAAFVPLMHHLINHVASGRSMLALEAPVGETTVGTTPLSYTVLSAIAPSPYGRLELMADAGAWRLRPQRTGVYRVASGEEEFGAFAANLDPAESNLTRLSAAEVKRLLQPLRVDVIAADGAGRLAAERSMPVTDLSRLMALLALLLLAFEAVYSLEEPEPTEESSGGAP